MPRIALLIVALAGPWSYSGSVAVLSAAEFSTRTVDGLNRPIAGVQVEVSCMSRKQKFMYFHLQSDQDGAVHGTYDAALCKPFFVSVEKQGYQSYSSGFRAKYVVRCQFSAKELLRVIRLNGDSQQNELRELLAGDFSLESHQFRDS